MPRFGFAQPCAEFPIYIGAGEGGLRRLNIGEPLAGPDWVRDDRDPLVRETARQLEEYFQGKRRQFDLPLELEGTPFQMRAWEALLAIPYGETRTYAEMARRIGAPGAARAVGGANHANPVAIVVPCHRVINTGGGLGGYGGGLERKRLLLDLESGARKIGGFSLK